MSEEINKEDGYVAIANGLVEQFAKINLSGSEWRILWAIFRKTYGWQKKADRISISQFEEITGMHRPNVVRAITKLIEKNIIIKNEKYINEYGLQKDVSKWGKVVAKQLLVNDQSNWLPNSYPPSSQTATGVVAKQLPKLVAKQLPTKDNKDNYTKPLLQKKDIVEKPFRHPSCFYQNSWNENMANTTIPKVKKITAGRSLKIKARIADDFFVSSWDELLAKIKLSPFCCGQNSRGWTVSFDWIIQNDTNYIKVLEGRYEQQEERTTGKAIALERNQGGFDLWARKNIGEIQNENLLG